MFPVIEKLLILQNRDQKIRAMRTELKVMPSQRLTLDARLVTAQTDFEAIRTKAQQLEIARKKLELDANAKRSSIDRFKIQQAQTRKNEEFQALAGEITRFENDITTIEDQELELMEAYESAKEDTTQASRALEETKASIQKQLSDLEAKTVTLGERLKELENDRKALTEGIDEDTLFYFDRLLKSKGDAAVVPVEHEVCMGCHMKVTTQTAVKVRGGNEMVECGNCGRILYEGE